MISTTVVLGPALAAIAVILWPRSSAARLVDATARPSTAAAATLGQARTVAGGGAGARLLRRLLGGRRRDPSPGAVGGEALSLLDALAPALGAGLTPQEALRAACAGTDAQLRVLLTPVIEAADDGRPLGPAWERVAQRTGQPDLAALARAWAVSERLGAPLAEAVRQTARSCRDRTLVQQRLASCTAGTRATSTLLTLLPVAGIGMAPLLGLDPVQLYATPVTWACLLIGGLLILLGRWIVGRMVARVEATIT